MRLQSIVAITLRKETDFIVGHRFEHVSAGTKYPVKSCQSYLLEIQDDSGQVVHVSKTALRKYFKTITK